MAIVMIVYIIVSLSVTNVNVIVSLLITIDAHNNDCEYYCITVNNYCQC